jgi:hypothetical protein
MSKCRWCETTLPGNAIPACSKCLHRTRDETDPSNEEYISHVVDSEKSNYDLSELGRVRDSQYSKGKTKGTVKYDLLTQTIYGEHSKEKQEILMKRVKIKSNSIRGRILVVDELVLAFDDDGIAEINESDLYVIVAYSRVRPGRLTVVVEPVEVPVPAPAPAPKKVEPKAESKKEEPKSKVVTKSESSKKVFKKPSEKDSE